VKLQSLFSLEDDLSKKKKERCHSIGVFAQSTSGTGVFVQSASGIGAFVKRHHQWRAPFLLLKFQLTFLIASN
jgi:hypothetical protein